MDGTALMPLQASVRDMDEYEEELERICVFVALLCLLFFAFCFNVSPYLNQAHTHKQWAWHICFIVYAL